MANIRAVSATIFIFALAVASHLETSECFLVKSRVSCLDCPPDFDYSGIKILLKCDGEKKPATATATKDGGFRAELPATGVNCLAKIQGGPDQIYARKHNMVSPIIKSEFEPNTYKTLNALSFSLSCPKPTGDLAGDMNGSSKTIDLFPGAGGFGFPPTGLMLPFLPIIGILC
ncbi:PREDICTED: uncharacterized protein LOC104810920 [Tarenaya hassleriana]|uniref:uncharacterized protein LOC104810920 n=1 Tax=Tarenaya hassleriana TaxID=28532 RepID=UPI0008FD1CB5|nr:PREDICTED: uncharacterized protein LOC104810920 [Tarenaya hassleriana]